VLLFETNAHRRYITLRFQYFSDSLLKISIGCSSTGMTREIILFDIVVEVSVFCSAEFGHKIREGLIINYGIMYLTNLLENFINRLIKCINPLYNRNSILSFQCSKIRNYLMKINHHIIY
jgi:hypothetical protein